MKKLTFVLFITLLAAGCGKINTQNSSVSTVTSTQRSQSPRTLAPAQPQQSTSQMDDFGNYTITHTTDYDQITSKDLGISFQYENDLGDANAATENGNMLSVEQGQRSIQVFNKAPQEDIKTAFTQQLLVNYPNCEIKAGGIQPLNNFQAQTYSLRPKAWDDTVAMQQWETQNPNEPEYDYHESDCPQSYQTFDGAVLWYIPQHPEKFFYVVVGQAVDPSSANGSNTPWFYTLKIQ